MSTLPLHRSGNETYDAHGTDISHHGLGLTTECKLERAQVIKLFLSVDHSKATLPVLGEVVWAQPINDKVRAGVRFLI